MQPTLFDPINDTTAAAAEEESVGPIRNDISGGREGGRERNITTAMIKVKWD